MTDIIIFGIIAAGMAIAWLRMLQDGMIFSNLRKQLERLPFWLYMPLGGCAYCSVVWIIIASCLVIGPKYLLSIGIAYIVIDYFDEY